MVQTLPNNYFLREHNREVYVTEKIHKDLHFLDLFPMVNNEYGEFTQYITDANADNEYKISDYEYPHCFKDVLLLTKSGKYTLGFYNGLKNLECCWFNYS